MQWLRQPMLCSELSGRLKMTLREVYRRATVRNKVEQAGASPKSCLCWARRYRLEPAGKLVATFNERFETVVRDMLDHRSAPYVEAMVGGSYKAKRATHGDTTSASFIAITYTGMSKCRHLPTHPFVPTFPR